MNVDEIYACSLKAAALNGQERIVTIEGGEIRKVEEGKRKIVLHFAEFKQPLFLNVTNARKIATIHGEEATLWKGKQLVLYPTETSYQGAEVPCIRIKPVPPPSAPVQPQQQQPTAQVPSEGAPVRF